jgi:hypothetical protein
MPAVLGSDPSTVMAARSSGHPRLCCVGRIRHGCPGQAWTSPGMTSHELRPLVSYPEFSHRNPLAGAQPPMPRRSRITVAQVPVHIIQRGNNRGACFFARIGGRATGSTPKARQAI